MTDTTYGFADSKERVPVVSKATYDADLVSQDTKIGAKQDKLTAGDNISITENVISASKSSLTFKDVTATPVESTTYTDYPYEAHLICEGVTADMMADVMLPMEQATSTYYAPYCETGAGEVIVYCKVADEITADVVVFR